MRVSVGGIRVGVGARWKGDFHAPPTPTPTPTPTQLPLPLQLTLIPQTHSEVAPTHPSDSRSHSSLRRTALIATLIVGAATARAQQPPYRNSSLPTPTRVKDLLGRMTPEEKF